MTSMVSPQSQLQVRRELRSQVAGRNYDRCNDCALARVNSALSVSQLGARADGNAAATVAVAVIVVRLFAMIQLRNVKRVGGWRHNRRCILACLHARPMYTHVCCPERRCACQRLRAILCTCTITCMSCMCTLYVVFVLPSCSFRWWFVCLSVVVVVVIYLLSSSSLLLYKLSNDCRRRRCSIAVVVD